AMADEVSTVHSVSWAPVAGPPIVLVRVEAASFPMGFAGSPDESPVHMHHVPSAYHIGRDPVTWAQYLAFCEATGHAPPQSPTCPRTAPGRWSATWVSGSPTRTRSWPTSGTPCATSRRRPTPRTRCG